MRQCLVKLAIFSVEDWFHLIHRCELVAKINANQSHRSLRTPSRRNGVHQLCNGRLYLSMLRLKLINVSKRGPWWPIVFENVWMYVIFGAATWTFFVKTISRRAAQDGLSLVWQYASVESLFIALQWRHNGCDSVSNHQPRDCFLSRLFRRRSKKTSKLRVTGLCAGNSSATGEFPAQRASNAENVSISWRPHGTGIMCLLIAYVVWFLLGNRSWDRSYVEHLNWKGTALTDSSHVTSPDSMLTCVS